MMRMQLAYAGEAAAAGTSLALISGIPLINCHHSCIHQGGGRRAEAGGRIRRRGATCADGAFQFCMGKGPETLRQFLRDVYGDSKLCQILMVSFSFLCGMCKNNEVAPGPLRHQLLRCSNSPCGCTPIALIRAHSPGRKVHPCKRATDLYPSNIAIIMKPGIGGAVISESREKMAKC